MITPVILFAKTDALLSVEDQRKSSEVQVREKYHERLDHLSFTVGYNRALETFAEALAKRDGGK